MSDAAQIWPLTRSTFPAPFYSASTRVTADYKAIGVNVRRRSGTILFCEGDVASTVSVIRFGAVKLTTLSREGKSLLVRIARPGEVLGLSAALCESRSEVTAQTLEDTLLRCYQQKDFLNFIRTNPAGGLYAAASLAHEYRSAFSDVCRLSLTTSIPSRVAHLLLEMLVNSEDTRPNHPTIDLRLTHQDIGTMLGSSRETITRTLNKFKRSGLIAIDGHFITILRRNALEAMV